MIWINTRRVITLMQHFKAIWYWAKGQFPTDAISQSATFAAVFSAASAKKAVAVDICARLPFPTFVCFSLCNLFPESFVNWARRLDVIVVACNKAARLASNMPLCLVCALGNWRKLTTATFAKFVFGGQRRLASIMSAKKMTRLAFNPSVLAGCLGRYLGFLTTAALAKTVGNILRGIIGVHRNLSFRCQAQDVCRVAGQLLLGSTRVIVSQESLLCQ